MANTQSPTSFYNQGEQQYSDTNPAAPADEPLINLPNTQSPTSFYESTGEVLTSLAEANFTLGISVPGGVLATSEWLFGFTFDFDGTFPTNLVGSQAVARVGSSALATLSLLKNGTQFATIAFNGTQGTFSGSQTEFVVGDVLELIAPASPDATLAHLTISLLGSRS